MPCIRRLSATLITFGALVIVLAGTAMAAYHATSRVGARQGAYPRGIRGDANMSIVVMDTGVDVTHPALLPITPSQGTVNWDNKVVAWLDFDNYTPDPNDETHHGTHTAFLAAGSPFTPMDAQQRIHATCSWSSAVGDGMQYPEFGGFLVDTPGEIRLNVWLRDSGAGMDTLYLMHTNNRVASWITQTREPLVIPHDDWEMFDHDKPATDRDQRGAVLSGWTPVAWLVNPPAGQWTELVYDVTPEEFGLYHIVSVRNLNGNRLYFIIEVHWPAALDAQGNLPDGEKVFTGVAPDAKITAVKAKTPGQWANAFAALRQNSDIYRTAVVSISQGTSSSSYSWANDIPWLFHNRGVITVAAAGNAGASGSNALSNPAAIAEAVAVAASNAADLIMGLSSQGGTNRPLSNGQMKPDILAPGGGYVFEGGIWSADFNGEGGNHFYGNPGSLANWGYDSNLDDAVPFYGTSMATPIVAGCLNLIIDALGGWDYWNDPAQGTRVEKARRVKQILFMTATETNLGREQNPAHGPTLQRGYDPSVPDPADVHYGKDPHEGYGRVNIDAALDVILEPPLTTGFTISSNLWSSRSAFINGVDEVCPATGHPLSPIDFSVTTSPHAWARRIHLEGGVERIFSLAVDAGADFDLYLYEYTPAYYGDPLIATRSVNDGFGVDEQIVFTPAASDTFYLVVKAVDGSGAFIFYDHDGPPALPDLALDIHNVHVTLEPGDTGSAQVLMSNVGDEDSNLSFSVAVTGNPPAGGGVRNEGRSIAGLDGVGIASGETSGGRSIAGSTLTCDVSEYTPGETVDLTLTVYNASTDSEWLSGITLAVPDGVVVNSSTAFQVVGSFRYLATDNTTGDGVTITWYDPNGGWGEIRGGESAVSTVNVTFGGSLAGDLVFEYTLIGDGWGSPPHTLDGTFTLHTTGPALSLLAPNGGEIWTIGAPGGVAWLASDIDGIRIDLSRDGGANWETLADGIPADSSPFDWTVTGPASSECLVRISCLDDLYTDTSNAVFSIEQPLTWLNVEPTGGVIPFGASEMLDLDFDAAGLDPDDYTAYVVITHNGPSSPDVITVTLTVTGSTSVGDRADLPLSLALSGAYPNPSGPGASIACVLPAPGHVRLAIHDASGRRVATLMDGPRPAGSLTLTWDGRTDTGDRTASGIYFVRLEAGGETRTAKVTLVR